MESTNLEPLALPTPGGAGRDYDRRAFTAWLETAPEEAG